MGFFTYCTLALYRFQSTSTFLYKATQVIPFPVARQGGKFIAYENYLFEVRRYKHYYENQQKVDFNTDAGQDWLDEYKRRALDKVINDAYIKRLAKQNNITVNDREIEDQITIWRSQDRLGGSDEVLEDVLKEFYGWTKNDFKRYARDALLQNKVLEALDTDAKGRAESALAELNADADFNKVAKKYSDDIVTKDKGGEYGFLIEKNNQDINPYALDAIFKLKAGETSGIVNTGVGLEIFKLIDNEDGKAKVAHILINFKDIKEYIDDQKEQIPTRTYIKLPEPKPEQAQPKPQIN